MNFPISSPSASKDKPLKGETIAMLVASGFNEGEMTESVRALMDTGAKVKLISVDAGLVQGWTGTGWGHYHAVDSALSSVLAADFSMMLILGGQRSIDKLKSSAHTTRFIKSFLTYGNPVAFFSDAVGLLAHVGGATDITVTGPAALEQTMTAAGGVWSPETIVVSGNILTAAGSNDQLKELAAATVAHFMTIPAELRLAA